MQLYPKPLDKLIDVTVFDMDEAKRRPMTLPERISLSAITEQARRKAH